MPEQELLLKSKHRTCGTANESNFITDQPYSSGKTAR